MSINVPIHYFFLGIFLNNGKFADVYCLTNSTSKKVLFLSLEKQLVEKAGQVPELTELLQGHESLNGWSSQPAGHIGIVSQPEHTGILSQPGLNGIVSQPLLDGTVSQPQLHGWVSRQPGYSNSLRKDQEHFEDWSSDPSANAWSSTQSELNNWSSQPYDLSGWANSRQEVDFR